MKPGTYYYSWETQGDAGVGTSLIDSDQMGVPTRCCAATEIAPRRLAAFLRNTLCTSRAEREHPGEPLNPAFNIHAASLSGVGRGVRRLDQQI